MHMQRSELARQAGCNLETIRYYEKIGLLPEPPRTGGGYRAYDQSHRQRLQFILRARELGFSIEEIRGLLGLVDGGDYTCGEIREITLHHLADVKAKIADLRRLERTLTRISSQCHGENKPECPIVEALSVGDEVLK
jgi:MerR family transcriptional regulator, mercuric resistance operon regulatory protein